MTSPAAPGRPQSRTPPRVTRSGSRSRMLLLKESREELGPKRERSPTRSRSLSVIETPPRRGPAPFRMSLTSKKLEALNDTSDTADSRAEAVDVPASDIMGAPTSSVPVDVSSAPVETNVADRAASLRYRGYLQTHQGGLIAFVEDLESKAMHRLETGTAP